MRLEQDKPQQRYNGENNFLPDSDCTLVLQSTWLGQMDIRSKHKKDSLKFHKCLQEAHVMPIYHHTG